MPLRQLHFCHRKFHPVIRVDAKVTGGARQTSGRITTSGAVKLTSLHCCPGLWATSIGRNVEAKLLVGWYRMCIVSPALHINIRIIYIYIILYMYRVYIPVELRAPMRVEWWSWWIEGMGANEHEGGLANNRCLFGDYWILYYHGCGSLQSGYCL